MVTGLSNSCLLIKLSLICKSVAASLWHRNCEDHNIEKHVQDWAQLGVSDLKEDDTCDFNDTTLKPDVHMMEHFQSKCDFRNIYANLSEFTNKCNLQDYSRYKGL